MVTPKQARWVGIVVLMITFAAGGVAGAATMHVVAADEVAPLRGDRRSELFERLDLTPEQQARVDAIIERRRQEVDAFWREHGPTMRAIYDSTRAEIRTVLTPEQVQLEEQFRAERQEHFQKRRGDDRTRR